MRGAFVACFGGSPAPGDLDRALAGMRWHTGEAEERAAGKLAALLLLGPDGPEFETVGDRVSLVHGDRARALSELEREGRRFAVVECRGSTAVAARDPLGLCPLFYRRIDDSIWFSTEVAPLA